jgi:hypothetical protein
MWWCLLVASLRSLAICIIQSIPTAMVLRKYEAANLLPMHVCVEEPNSTYGLELLHRYQK